MHIGRDCLSGLALKQFGHNLLVPLAQLAQALFHHLAIAEACGIQHAQNEVGYLRQGRHHHDDLVAALGVPLHNTGSLADSFGVADRCPAELHHSETHEFLCGGEVL